MQRLILPTKLDIRPPTPLHFLMTDELLLLFIV
jgi:hypothetical protein